MNDQSHSTPRRLLRAAATAAITALTLALVLAAAYPGHVRWVKALAVRERNGCGLRDAVDAVSYTARQRALTSTFWEQSRVVRNEDGLSLWTTPHGSYWAPSDDPGHLFVLAELRLEPYATADVAVRKGDVVLDCGAYVGQYTREALDAGASRVIAIEPGTRQMACLRRTFAGEAAAGRVVLVNKGVWAAEGQLVFQDSGFSDASFVEAGFQHAAGSVAKNTLPVTTIDALVEGLKLDRVDVIKMDIEGSEQEALEGAARTLARFKPRLAIAAYHKATDPVRIPAVVRRANATYRFASAGCRLDLPQIRPLTFFFF